MIRSVALMGTIVTIHVVGPECEDACEDVAASIERAFDWFRRVEACCTRFDPASELMQLTSQAGVAVPVSELLFEAVRFAIAVAEESGGAFDPTVGHQMETRGFNREYTSGRVVDTTLGDDGTGATYEDVTIDPNQHTITIHRPLVLDLGAVAKGMAVDLAARELSLHANFAIDAGGDLYLAGCGPGGAPWSVGIRHPRLDRQLIDAVRISNMAVCTSGDYERGDASRSPKGSPVPLDACHAHHILDARTGASANAVASVTVLAPTAMVADALATAAFVLGPVAGIPWLEKQGVEGLIFSSSLERFETRGMRSVAAGLA